MSSKIRIKFSSAKQKKHKKAGAGYLAGVLQQALTFHQAGNFPHAEIYYRQILSEEPNHPEALNFLGMLAHQTGKGGVAVDLVRRALQVKPDYADAHGNLGLIFHDQGELDQAVASFRRALSLKPDYPEVLSNLGSVLKDQGKLDEAAASFRHALDLMPDCAEMHSNLGNVLKEQGRLSEAIDSYRRALSLQPDLAEVHNNLGVVLTDHYRLEEAGASFRKAISLRPDYAEAHHNLGIVLQKQIKFDEAIANYRQAFRLKPQFLEAHSNLLFCLNFSHHHSISEYLAEARGYGRAVSSMARKRLTGSQIQDKLDCLRVGLVSADFRNHPVGYFLESVVAGIEPSKIELFAYSFNAGDDELTGRIRPYFAAWKSLRGVQDEAAAHLIQGDHVHILLDLSGHTKNNRLSIFAWKPAPIQATWLGYFASTGLEEMDYLIADHVCVPENNEEQFIEKVWLLPEIRFCFSPPAGVEESGSTPLPALRNGFPTFGCFQQLEKLNDAVLAAWGEIFRLLPQARLRLQNPSTGSSEVVTMLLERLARNGIEPDNVIIEKPVPRAEYLAAHAHIDILLDTFPFPGGTTTCESLWMGVPTVTLAGNTMLARQGASLLACAGLNDWIANDPGEYVAKAVAFASELEGLAKLRGDLRKQVSASPLFDAQRFARNFEAAMWGMWRRYQDEQSSLNFKMMKSGNRAEDAGGWGN
jgi:protein O-GlcNAc transferase